MAKKISGELVAKIKLAAEQMNGRIPYKEQEELDKINLIPEVGIKGTNHIFCYQPESKSFIKIDRGQKALVIEDRGEKYLIYTYSGHLVEVNKEDVFFSGFD
tara:strand:- start:104 stop:409 length:306 start_codon:yes stop_codon:yes gene_type:complete